MARVRELGVWMDGRRVATLTAPKVGRVRLTYERWVLAEHAVNVPLLSCSLPVRSGSQDAWAFTSGLLPEGAHRQAMAALAGVTVIDLLGMLARFGRDVAGALVISDSEPSPRQGRVEPLDDAALGAEVAALPDVPLGLHPDSELSVAGLQDKLLVVRGRDGSWGRPVHGYPSTHIVKADDLRHPGIVEAEHACLTLARSAGLPAASASLVVLAGRPCLVVERFDRVDPGDGITRVHQEDACQALGIDPEKAERRAKYESAGGPSFAAIARLLEAWGTEAELWALLDRLVFTVVIGDADAHGKNVALLHPSPSELALAPLYDTVPTMLWPGLRADAAMSVGGVRDLNAITVADVVREATRWGLSALRARLRVGAVLERLDEAARTLEPVGPTGRRALALAGRRARALAR